MTIPTVATEPLLKTIRMAERFNEVVEAERSIFLTVASGLSPYNSVDLPANGTAWSAHHVDLRLEERAVIQVTSTDVTNDRYEMRLVYRLQRPLAEAITPVRGGMTIENKSIVIDKDGNLIGAQHGDAKQTAEVTVPAEGQRFVSEFAVATNNPMGVVIKWGNAVNNAAFKDSNDVGLWRIASVEYDRIFKSEDGGTDRHIFTFEFEFKFDGWTYPAPYEDASGVKPDALEVAVVPGDYTKGVVAVPWHIERNFNELTVDPTN